MVMVLQHIQILNHDVVCTPEPDVMSVISQLKTINMGYGTTEPRDFLVPTEGEDRAACHLSPQSAAEHVHRAPQAGAETLR